nr:Imm1 family immunity protein [Alloactinosynnema sp. L-07]
MYYSRSHSSAPIRVQTEDEVDALVDQVREESPAAAPVLMQCYISDDIHSQELSVGVVDTRGVIRYAGEDASDGVYSTGVGSSDGEPLAYFYMDTWTGFPANSEVSLDVVRPALKQYLLTDGARPTGVSWQYGPEADL